MDIQQTECVSILMTTICMSEIAAIIYASLLKKWSLMEVKLNLSINPNRQKTRKSVCSVIKYNILKRKISGRYISVPIVIMQKEEQSGSISIEININ